VLFAVFALAPFIDTRDRDLKLMTLLALLNAGTYFFEVWELFEHAANARRGAMAALGLAGLYLVMGYLLSNGSRTVLRQVHWAIAAAFAVAAVPIGLETPWITIGWFAEGAALIHASRRTNNNYLRNLAAIAVVMAFARLIAVDEFQIHQLVFNARMMTFAVGILSLYYIAHQLRPGNGQYERAAIAILVVAGNVLALLALTEEITDAWRRQVQVSGPANYQTLGIIRDFAYSALWMSYGAGLIFIGFWKKSAFLRYQALILIAITVAKVFLYDTSSLDRGYRILSFIALGLLLLTTSFLYQRNRMNEKSSL
jgi:uncharacterized membrane protein